MIEILLKFNTVAEAAAALAKFNGQQLGATTVSTVALAGVSTAEKDAVQGKATTEKPKAEKAATPSPAPAPTVAATPPSAGTGQTDAQAVDYPTLQKAVFKLSGIVKGADLDAQEHVLSIAKGLGADTFKVLKPEQWADALAAVNAKIADLEATLQAA